MKHYRYCWESNYGDIEFHFEVDNDFFSSWIAVTISKEHGKFSTVYDNSQDGILVFVNANLNGRPLNGKIYLKRTEDGCRYIQADLEYGQSPVEQTLEGVLIEDCFEKGKIKIKDKETVVENSVEFALSDPTEDADLLFPYIDISPWPDLTDDELNFHFVKCPWGGETGPLFFNNLMKAENYSEAFFLSVEFINSSSFIRNSFQLQGAISLFSKLEMEAEIESVRNPEVLLNWLYSELREDNRENIISYLNSNQYTSSKDLLWLSWIALVIVNGYLEEDLEFLESSIVFCHFVETLLGNYDDQSPVELIDEARQLLKARIVFPNFPFLNGVANFSGSSDNDKVTSKGSVYPYAIGELKQVRHRFLGYSKGELASVENIMKGEKRSLSHNLFDLETHLREYEGSSGDNVFTSSINDDSNIRQEAIANAGEQLTRYTFHNLKSEYGAPNAFTMTGNYTNRKKVIQPETGTTGEFAQKVLNQANKEIRNFTRNASKVFTQKSKSQETSSQFDNSLGSENVSTAYWWLNKVFEAEIVHCGSRFLLEFVIENPAAEFIVEAEEKYGIQLEFPSSPADFGIAKYSDVINSQKIIDALIYFDVYEGGLFEDEELIVSRVVQPGQALDFEIPNGYECMSAKITAPDMSNGAVSIPFITGFVGTNSFNTHGVFPLTISLNKETKKLSVSLTEIIDPSSLSILKTNSVEETTATVISDFSIGVEITCNISSELKTLNQVKIYKKILESYQRLKEEYFVRIENVRLGTQKLFHCSDTELILRNLRQQCVSLLMDIFQMKTGLKAETDPNQEKNPASIYEPVIQNFFHQAVEWNEMSALFFDVSASKKMNYSPTDHTALLNGEKRLESFLRATYTRVLVPVASFYEYQMLFFLSSGIIWQGEERITPVCEGDIRSALTAMLNRKFRQKREVEKKWRYHQPTGHKVLGDMGLSEFERKFNSL